MTNHLLRAILAIGLAFAGHASVEAAPKSFDDYQIKLKNDLRLDWSGYFGESPVTVAELQGLARSARDYAAFLSALHERAPYLFENHVLLHATGSIQTASKTHPRVVLFGDGLLLAFSEDPASPVRKVEILAFDQATLAFSAHELRFAPGAAAKVTDDPAACAACHGPARKPIWEPYDFWPNAYGSAISRMQTREEREAYEAFFQRHDREGVYAYLTDQSSLEGDVRRVESIEAFTMYVEGLNFLRTAGALKAKMTAVKPLRFALYGALHRCNDQGDGLPFKDAFPQGVLAAAPKSYETLLADTRAARQAFKTYLDATYRARFPGGHAEFTMDHARLGKESTIMAQVRFVLENAGVSVEDLALTSGMNRYFASTPSNFGLDWLTALAAFDRDGFAEIDASYFGPWISMSCDTLKQKSQESLSAYAFPEAAPAKSELAPVMHCVRCHTGPSPRAPAIPFDDTMQLRQVLAARPDLADKIRQRLHATDATRMPPYGSLLASGVAAFEAFLTELAP